MRIQRIALGSVVAAIAFAGCGESEDFANEPRPPAPINIDGVITAKAVNIDPVSFGAGPIVLRVANLTEQPLKVTVEAARAGLRQTSSAINPDGAGTLKIDLEEGTYIVSVDDEEIGTARVEVGRERESSQDELLQP